jgi:molecular chaperone IbpA
MSRLTLAGAHRFAPLLSTYLGFDNFFSEIDQLMETSSANTGTFPPMNLFKEIDGGYTIELAVAGFKKEDLKITLNKDTHVLTISGDARPKVTSVDANAVSTSSLTETPLNRVAENDSPIPTRKTIKSSIATRLFWRSFTISETLEVASAKLENGLLVIRLVEFKQDKSAETLIDIS